MLKRGKVHLVFLFAALLATTGFAGTYTWVAGATDWDSEDSYKESGKPGQGEPGVDIVLLPKGVTVTVDDDSVNFINKLKRIKLDHSTAEVVFNLTTNAVVTCEVTYATGTSNMPYGTIRQNGSGIVTLSAEGTAAYYVNIITTIP